MLPKKMVGCFNAAKKERKPRNEAWDVPVGVEYSYFANIWNLSQFS